MSLFFFFLSFVCFAGLIHPFITYPLSLHFLKKQPVKKSQGNTAETYAICMCAYNEEAVIEDKAQNLLALKAAYPGLSVHIYVDCASDKTADILQKYKDDFDVVVSDARHGKTYGMNLLVSRANASIIVFTDANVMLDIPALANLAPYFADPEVGCVCGHLKYINADDGVTAATGSLYWRIEEIIKQAESDTGSVMGADGSIFAIRRALHVAPPADIIDDMFVSLSILCNGPRVVRAPDVIAYEKSVTAPKEEFKRKVRISCQAFNVHRLLWPRLKGLDSINLYKYISHKLLRWFGMAFIILGLFFFLVSLIAADMNGLAFFISVMLVAALWAGTVYELPVLPQIIDILMSYAATGLGLWKSISGERFQTWSPAQSIRQKDAP